MSKQAIIAIAFIGWILFISCTAFFVGRANQAQRSAQVSRAWECEMRGGVAVFADLDGVKSLVACLNKEAVK